ncbi:MAG TPA: transglutaminase family protein [Burkholderiales bacterium]|nr:transglutaminase family protein [Burkholderiales bacterium]
MKYQVIHETRYSYEAPVVLSQQLLHLTPRVLGFQTLEQHRVAIEPEPAETTGRNDYFGNPVTQIVLAQPHSALSVRAESLVTVAARSAPASDAPWEQMRELLRRTGSAHALEAMEFLFESPHVECFRDLANYALPSFGGGRRLVDAALDLTRRIHGDFKFDPKATSVSTPLREVLAKRRGVCQDFAHLMIGCLRTLGLSARYVSGYILTAPPPGKPRLVGADASHAWVSVYRAGGAGEAGSWIDFDPTNNCLVSDAHVTLAWGRDFDDVTPMRGVILGGGEQELEVRVTVTPLAA